MLSVPLQKCNGIMLDGRNIRVDYSRTQAPHEPTPGKYMGIRREVGRGRYYEGEEGRWEGIMEGRVEDIMMKDDLDMITEGMTIVDPLHPLPPSQEVNVVEVIIMLRGGIMTF